MARAPRADGHDVIAGVARLLPRSVDQLTGTLACIRHAKKLTAWARAGRGVEPAGLW
ncbi:MAG: hypothetical protein ACE367_21665 [Acidimicrobiales bacterium]